MSGLYSYAQFTAKSKKYLSHAVSCLCSMLTIEVSEEEEEENKEGSEEEEEAEEDKTEGILVEKHTRDSKDITKGSSLPEE